ncbi:hypothetical protein [Nitrosomonas sp.]|uniref:hypothetical protein n=1 Tax=Nitrosomonas sp. TaxID=42353 RepID=UPI0025E92882|nr:hypothetical protein [Nitrosomonas sp.]
MTINHINLSSLDGSNGFRLPEGRMVTAAGDINGDGFGDFTTGTYVVFGTTSGFDRELDLNSLDGSNGFALIDYYGAFGSQAGDINGDGFDDLFVSIRGDSGELKYVVFGKAAGFNPAMTVDDLNNSANGFRVINASTGLLQQNTTSAISAGDVNGDGYDDLFVGQYIFRGDGYGYYANSSNLYVVFGKPTSFGAALDLTNLDGSNGFSMKAADNDGSGRSISNAGDINGDGFDDLIMGAPGAGHNYVVFGKASGFDATMDLTSLNGSNGFILDGVGPRSVVSDAGDVNGDGFDDVIIGDQFSSLGSDRSGSSYVVFGKASGFDATMDLTSLDGNNGFRLDGEAAGDSLGLSVSNAGDVNGDGFDDVIVSAPTAAVNGFSSGSSYVIFGKASGFDAVINLSELDSNAGVRLDGVGRNSSGYTVSGAGDINGDGFDDLNVRDRPFTAEYNYVIFGRSDFTNEVDFPGTAGDDNFTGTSAAERFDGGAGNDRMIGRGGADSFDGGVGNDYIRISDASFQLVDGGSGTDILGLAGSGFNLDLSTVQGKIHGIETISLYGLGDNTLTLTAAEVLNLSDETNTLKIKGNTGDSVVGLSNGWVDGGIHGNFHTYTQDEAVLLIGIHVATDFPVI